MIVTDTPDIVMSGARDTPSLGVRGASTSSAPSCATRTLRRHPRVDPARESSRLAIAGAVPAGSTRAPAQKAFMDAVDTAPALVHLRSDGYATLRAVARHMALWADWDLLTTRPTWEVLAAQVGCARSTVGRSIALLRRAGLVGVVATGRSAKCTPAALGRAEAAVYVLCVPSSPTLSAAPTTPVDEDDTPSFDALSFKENPPHTRGAERKKTGTHIKCQTKTGPTHHRWTPSYTPRRPDERQAASQALQERFPALRRISTPHVASRIRDFILAGWSVADIGFALDRRPDGTPWPHDGAHGVGNVGAWLRYRLAAWRDEAGRVALSPAQRDQARHDRELARQVARREQQCADRAARPQMGSTVVGDALAQIRAALPRRWTYA